MSFWRVSCSAYREPFSSLQRFIHLERYQTKTNELEKLVVELFLLRFKLYLTEPNSKEKVAMEKRARAI